MLDEDGGRTVVGQKVLLPKNVDLLKVLHDWLLWRRQVCINAILHIASIVSLMWQLQ